jgi:hypothetical protein
VGDVAAGDEEIGVSSQLAGEEVGAEEVRATSVATVVGARVPAVELLEGARNLSAWRGEHEVVMVAEERIGDQPQIEALDDKRQSVEKGRPVIGDQEQVARVASMRGKVVDPFDEGARLTRHASSVRACDRAEAKRKIRYTLGTHCS